MMNVRPQKMVQPSLVAGRASYSVDCRFYGLRAAAVTGSIIPVVAETPRDGRRGKPEMVAESWGQLRFYPTPDQDEKFAGFFYVRPIPGWWLRLYKKERRACRAQS